MATKITKLGPGKITIGTAPFDFSCEVRGGAVTHDYDTEDPETMLCGDVVSGKATRTDGLTFQLYNDLTDTGLYAYLIAHDLESVDFEYTPNTDTTNAGGDTITPAKWSGTVRLTLPDEVGADEYGANIESEVEWEGVGHFTFAAATVTAAGGSV